MVLNVKVFTTLMRLFKRDMPCLLMEQLQGNSGYGIDVWDIFHLGTLRFYFLLYLLVTLSPSNVKLVYGQRIIELLLCTTSVLALNRRGASYVYVFQMHHNVGYLVLTDVVENYVMSVLQSTSESTSPGSTSVREPTTKVSQN